MITKRQIDLEKLEKIHKLGLHIHIGEDNHKWKGGISYNKNYPCPKCGKDRKCQKKNSNRICWECHVNRGREKSVKVYRRDWQREQKQKSKKFAIQYLGGACQVCGVEDLPPCCYHFHHKNPKEKSFTLGSKFNQKINDTTIKELDKCALLCANCHAVVHWYEEIDL